MDETNLNSWSEFENEVKNLEQFRKERSEKTKAPVLHSCFLEDNLIRVGNLKRLGKDIAETRQNYMNITN